MFIIPLLLYCFGATAVDQGSAVLLCVAQTAAQSQTSVRKSNTANPVIRFF